MPERVSFFIDGFNVYHSIRDALRARLITRGKWLDYSHLCEHYLSNFSTDAIIERIRYFSAYATHLTSSGVPARHHALVRALQATGIEVKLGNFKRKDRLCNGCSASVIGYEEKETDINIALALVEAFITDECDTAVIVSGDTDLVTAVKTVKRLFPTVMLPDGTTIARCITRFLPLSGKYVSG